MVAQVILTGPFQPNETSFSLALSHSLHLNFACPGVFLLGNPSNVEKSRAKASNHRFFKPFGCGVTCFTNPLVSSCSIVQSLGGNTIRQNRGEGFTNSIPISCLSN
jgi:hypothetical protein